jgi:hypothetical protein
LPNGAAPKGAAFVEAGAFAPKGEPPKGALPPKGGAFAPGKFLAAGKLFDMANYTPLAKFTANFCIIVSNFQFNRQKIKKKLQTAPYTRLRSEMRFGTDSKKSNSTVKSHQP